MIAFGSQDGKGARILALLWFILTLKTRLLVCHRSAAGDHDLAVDFLGPCSELARVLGDSHKVLSYLSSTSNLRRKKIFGAKRLGGERKVLLALKSAVFRSGRGYESQQRITYCSSRTRSLVHDGCAERFETMCGKPSAIDNSTVESPQLTKQLR